MLVLVLVGARRLPDIPNVTSDHMLLTLARSPRSAAGPNTGEYDDAKRYHKRREDKRYAKFARRLPKHTSQATVQEEARGTRWDEEATLATNIHRINDEIYEAATRAHQEGEARPRRATMNDRRHDGDSSKRPRRQTKPDDGRNDTQRTHQGGGQETKGNEERRGVRDKKSGTSSRCADCKATRRSSTRQDRRYATRARSSRSY